MILCAASMLWGSAAIADEYVGSGNCKTCHPNQYAHWRRTPHARAFARLTGTQRRDPACTGCHATDAQGGHVGVQCESCHGPGAHYWPEHVMRDTELARAVGLRAGNSPEICGRCHTAESPSLRAFDFKTALKAVIHPPAQGKQRP
ncbi:MAG: multiheme c-type cytochrome [Bradymonadia bacterium]